MANVLEWDMIISEFELQSLCCVHFPNLFLLSNSIVQSFTKKIMSAICLNFHRHYFLPISALSIIISYVG